MRVNTNIASLQAQRNLSTVTRALARSMERLSSGSRINSARDDASGLAVSNGLEAQVRAMRQATRNLNDAFGFLNTAEGAMAEQTQIVQRMRELAVQAANGTYSNADRANLDGELQELLNEYNRLVTDTDFNGTKLLDGSLQRLLLQVGSEASHRIDVSLQSTKAIDAFTAEVEDAGIETVGTGTFSYGTTMDSIPLNQQTSHGVSVVDLNGDDEWDLVYTNRIGNTIAVRLGNGDGTFSAGTTMDLPAGSQPFHDITVLDINGDSEHDLIFSNYGGNTITVRLGNGDGTFAAAATIALPASSETYYDTVLTDINNDTEYDIIQSTRNFVAIRLGNGDGTFAAAATITLPANSRPTKPVLADINGDSELDIIVSNNTNNSISILLGNGDGSFAMGTTLALGANANSVAVADINGDSELDIVTTAGSAVSVRLGNGDGTFAVGSTISLASAPLDAARLIDLDGDSALDMVVSVSFANYVSVYRGNGDGTFALASTLTTGLVYELPAIEDLNGDDVLDLVVASRGDNASVVYLGNGDGTFSLSASIAMPSGSFPTATPSLVDLDGDGVLDILQRKQGNGASAATDGIGIFLGISEDQESAGTLTVEDLSIATQSEAEDSLDLIDAALDVLASARAGIGAIQNRLESAASVSASSIESLSAARSQLVDSDVADETAEFAKTQILQQGTLAVLTNANLSSRLVLDLLRF